MIVKLEPVVIRGIRSEGMLLAADVGGKPYLLSVDRNPPTGSKIA